jgi:hypothetical protein
MTCKINNRQHWTDPRNLDALQETMRRDAKQQHATSPIYILSKARKKPNLQPTRTKKPKESCQASRHHFSIASGYKSSRNPLEERISALQLHQAGSRGNGAIEPLA